MWSMGGTDDPLARALAEVVGSEHVLTDPELRAGYERDWTGRFQGRARLVVRPGSTAETAEVVRRCAEAGAAIVPQGGNTGLVGGSVPRGGEVVLSLARMSRVEPIDETASQVTAEAGATIAAVQEAARASGLEYPVDLASRGSATVGGTIATNAGGMYVGRYGPTRAQVVGIEAVLADGSIVSRMGGLLKDNTGYDLAGLFCGSEGTLAVVTRARLRLVPALPRRAVAVVGLGSLGEAAELGALLRKEVESVLALEAFFPEGAELVHRHLGVSLPFERHPGCYLLVECGSREDPAPELAAALERHLGSEWAVLGTTGPERARLWRLREGHPEAIAAEGIPQKLDVTVPLARLGLFEREVRRRLASSVPGARPILFGHIGDGNIHVNVLGADPNDERVAEAVFTLAAELEGSISAEHGIGVAKVRWLHLTRSEADIRAMRAIKRALDPTGILNPGVLFPAE
jgi:FAD/FMN-containing dehydrogenase